MKLEPDDCPDPKSLIRSGHYEVHSERDSLREHYLLISISEVQNGEML